MQRAVVILAVFLLLGSWPAAAQDSDPFREDAPSVRPTPGPDPFRVAPEQQAVTPPPAIRPRSPHEPDPVVALPPPPPPRPAAPDGDWLIAGARLYGNPDCGTWGVHLRVSNGQLSGTVTVLSGSRELQGLTISADGSFNGATGRGVGVWGGRPEKKFPVFAVAGKFSGDVVKLTLSVSGSKCDLQRSGEARRTGG
jgi:hypothetical protein